MDMKSNTSAASDTETNTTNTTNQTSTADNKSSFFNENQKQGVHIKASANAKLNEQIPYVGGSEIGGSVEIGKPDKPGSSIS